MLDEASFACFGRLLALFLGVDTGSYPLLDRSASLHIVNPSRPSWVFRGGLRHISTVGFDPRECGRATQPTSLYGDVFAPKPMKERQRTRCGTLPVYIWRRQALFFLCITLLRMYVRAVADAAGDIRPFVVVAFSSLYTITGDRS